MRGTKKKNNNLLVKSLIVVLAIAAVIGGAIYSYVVFQRAYTVYPEKVFKENFATPVDRIHNLVGGGDISSYYNIWLRFDCGDIIHLAHPENWQQSYTFHQASEWWRFNHPEEPGTQDSKELDCWVMQQHPNVVEISNGEMLFNRKLNRYYFRIWGRK